MFVVTGSPTQPFIDALKTALEADAVLMALLEGVFGHLSEAARTAYPYLVLGRRTRDNSAGTFEDAGGRVTVQLDGWSDHRGASEMQAIGSHVARVLERRTLLLAGFTMVAGSLTCEMEEVFEEPDADKPGSLLYHGVQRWACEIHES